MRHYYPKFVSTNSTVKEDSDKIAKFIEENGVTKVEPKFAAGVSSALSLTEEQNKLENLKLQEPPCKSFFGRLNRGR